VVAGRRAIRRQHLDDAMPRSRAEIAAKRSETRRQCSERAQQEKTNLQQLIAAVGRLEREIDGLRARLDIVLSRTTKSANP